VGVVGAGTMGAGVSQLFAQAGLPVVLVDHDEGALEHAHADVRRGLRMQPLLTGAPAASPESPDKVLGLISLTTDPRDLCEADYVVENVTEKWDVKERLYPELDRICPERCVFGVNTSAISITRIGALTGRPDRVVGTHFMNPAPLKPMVELIRGFHTSDDTISATAALLETAGRTHIVVSDSPGFVTNRVAMLTVNEAIFLLHEGVAPAAEIDRLFKQCFGHPMGPLETADLIGLDTVLYSLDVLLDSFNDPKYRPCPLLRRLVAAGRLGRKSGQGFYSYTSQPVGRAS
jgi:3-hydroxybutyryl-CoA dehydrogenase